MLVPDPTGAVNSNVRTVSFVRGNTTGTLGHEFQHMINGLRRAYVTGASFFETGFLNEGLSHIAEELMFYRTSVGGAAREHPARRRPPSEASTNAAGGGVQHVRQPELSAAFAAGCSDPTPRAR